MPVVFDNWETAGQQYAQLRRVDVWLVASLTDAVTPGVIPGSDITIMDKVTAYTNGAGYVAVTLRANSLITPANTYYVWESHFADGRVSRRYISVTNGAGPYHVADLEISPATAVTPFVAVLDGQGTQASMPSAATMVAAGNRAGWRYWATDSTILWRFDGTNWRIVAGSVGGKIRRNAALSVSNNTATDVSMDTTIEDPCAVTGLGTFYDSTAPGKLKVPTVTGLVLDGLYRVTAGISWALGGTGRRELYLTHSSLGTIASDIRGPADTYSRSTVTTTARFTSGQTVKASVLQTQGSALSVDILSSYSPVLSMWRVGD